MGPIGHSFAAIAALAGAPAVALGWVVRPAWREGLSERLGAFPSADAEAPVWIHGASVGETLAAGRLVDRLVARGDAVVTSTMTPTGRGVARAPANDPRLERQAGSLHNLAGDHELIRRC